MYIDNCTLVIEFYLLLIATTGSMRAAIEAGMIPKVEACLETLQKGVRKIHIIDGRIRHSLMLEIYTNQGIGTEIVTS